MTNDMVKETAYPWDEPAESGTPPVEVLEKEPPSIPNEVLEAGPPVVDQPEETPPKETEAETPKVPTEAEKAAKEHQVKRYMNERIIGDFTQQELDVLQSTIASGTTKEEFRLFVQTCVNTNLNPFLNHIYPIVYDGKDGRKLSLQISVEGIMSLARKAPGYKGVDVQLVHENDEFKMARENGAMKVAVHEFGFPRGQVVGGYAVARREGFEDAVTVMEKDEVKALVAGKNSNMWTKFFNDMFRKHILKRAAKEQYGIEVTEEPVMGEAPSVKDFRKRDIVGEEKKIETGEGESVPESEAKKNLWATVFQLADDKGMNVMEIDELIIDKFPGKNRDDLTAQQIAALQKFVQFYKRAEPDVEEVTDIEFTEVAEDDSAENAEPEEETKQETAIEKDDYESVFD